MSAVFEELDRQATAMGEISLRRRIEPTLGVEVFEVKLGDEYLMSSLFTVAETVMADLALDRLKGEELDVVVGGLGLGYTARSVLKDTRVRTVTVVEALGEVIDWHKRDLLPLAEPLTKDPRCRLVPGDFFALVAQGSAFDDRNLDRHHAFVIDIDHSPSRVLHPSHAPFYERAGLQMLADRLHPGGVFALWSDDPPDGEFMADATAVFGTCAAHVVSFPNFYTGGESTNTVYVAQVG